MKPRRYASGLYAFHMSITIPGAKTRAQLFAERANPPELRYLRDPDAWARERAGIELWSKQRQVIESVRDNARTAVHSCHEIGKSFVAATTVCWWLDTHIPGEAFVVTTAPTAPQVKAILWREINRIHERAGLKGRTNLTEWYMGGELVAFGRKPSDYNNNAFQGQHARYFLVVLDEACGIPKNLWDSASTLAANPRTSRQLAIGNPDDPVGEFATVCKEGSGWNTLGISAYDTPNFTGEPVSQLVADSLIHPEWVQDRERHWGKDSALFQSKCLGKFPETGDPWQVVPLAWANQCKWLDYPIQVGPVEAGVDVGAGNDRTVVTIRQQRKVLAIYIFVNSDPVKTTGEIARILREHKVVTAKVDSIGVGWGIWGSLRESSSMDNPTGQVHGHDANVVPINVALAPTSGNEGLYYNRRAEMWWLGREHSRLKQWDFSNLSAHLQDQLIHELTMPKYEIVDANGKVKIERKEEIIKRLKASPDLAESVLLAYVPASWAADISSAQKLIAAPSLLGSLSPFGGSGPGFRTGAGGGW